MSSRHHPSVDSNEYSRLDTFSEASTSESSSNGTYEDKSQESAFELHLGYTAGYNLEEFYREELKHERKSKGRIQGRASEAVGKGKAQIAARRSKKPLPKFNRGVPIIEIFLKTGSPKRARVSVDPLEFVPYVPPPEMVVLIQIIYESDKGSSSGSIKVEEYI
ncbi:hypothetical protein ACOSP7_026687 [Xanthoceras sorbifolium]